MPELPEVETIRQELASMLPGKTIKSVAISRADIVGYPNVHRFQRQVQGLAIKTVERQGKYLVLRLQGQGGSSPGRLLVIHLRLSGQLIVLDAASPEVRFERARFVLSGGKSLVFVEPRVLGRVYLVRDGKLPKVLRGLANLGLEPINPKFDLAYLRGRLRQRTACIKSLLLDQRIAAGVGNIYSDEALFRAGIRPTRAANRISHREMRRLVSSLKAVLKDGIKHMGTTMRDARYLRPGREPGGFQSRLQVFGREGEPCRRCWTLVRSCRIGNRTSRYCPKCQV